MVRPVRRIINYQCHGVSLFVGPNGVGSTVEAAAATGIDHAAPKKPEIRSARPVSHRLIQQSMTSSPELTGLLKNWVSGDPAAGDALIPLIYDELHKRAARLFRGENPAHTLQPTALVHEAYAKLIDVEIDWKDRAHFYALAARMMKRLLINHANARLAAKRGGDAVMVTLVDSQMPGTDTDSELLDLAEALKKLAAHDQRKAELVEMKYFGGMTTDEISAVTELSVATIGRDLRFARAWLKDQLSEDE